MIRLGDLGDGELEDLISLSLRLKRGGDRKPLLGTNVGLLFFRGSLRTRTSFTAAVHQLGGDTINLTASSDFWDLEEGDGGVMDGRAPEHIRDAAAALSSYCDALAIRPAPAGQSWTVDRRDAVIHSWARHARVPVINMESALWHPLQALADLLTLHETLGELRGRKLAITWTHSPDAGSHSVTNSLLHAAVRAGMSVRIAHPSGYELEDSVLEGARDLGAKNGGTLELAPEKEAAVEGADVVYARSWRSLQDYGKETLAANRRSRHADWTVDEALMAKGNDARLMHAMPIRRNLEVSDGVLDGPRSLVYEQAANRLHSQKALLTTLLRP